MLICRDPPLIAIDQYRNPHIFHNLPEIPPQMIIDLEYSSLLFPLVQMLEIAFDILYRAILHQLQHFDLFT